MKQPSPADLAAPIAPPLLGSCRRDSIVLLAILLLGCAFRLAYVHRPLDARIRSPWRQADSVQMARNFYREDSNILYPRIDWRRDTPGYVEAEFPVLPWLGGMLYKVFGYHEQILRALSSTLGIASLFLFLQLARFSLPPPGVLAATAFFAFNPLLFHLATSMQPEPLMLVLSMAAVLLIWRWEESPSLGLLMAASSATAGAVLAKGPAMYLGFILLYTVWQRMGTKIFSSWQMYLAGLVAALPPLAWYTWAAHFWRDYGNSLGLSNGHHFLSWDQLFPPWFLVGILKWETAGVFTPIGWFLAAAAIIASARAVRRPLVWYTAVFVLYLVAARTTSNDWAFYYHASTVAPACLLMGAGAVAILDASAVRRRWTWIVGRGRPVALVATFAVVLSCLGLSLTILRLRDGRTDLTAMYKCSGEFQQWVPTEARIAVTGDERYDRQGNENAYQISMVFAWMDRKGFSYGSDELSVDTLDEIARRGGWYWIASEAEIEKNQLGAAVAERYSLIDECDNAYRLYDLRTGP